jgi:hypothetical protein
MQIQRCKLQKLYVYIEKTYSPLSLSSIKFMLKTSMWSMPNAMPVTNNLPHWKVETYTTNFENLGY